MDLDIGLLRTRVGSLVDYIPGYALFYQVIEVSGAYDMAQLEGGSHEVPEGSRRAPFHCIFKELPQIPLIASRGIIVQDVFLIEGVPF